MIAIGSDHAGYEMKLAIIEHLKKRGEQFEDFGCYSNESVDYPEYGKKVAHAVASGEYEKGILICGTGIGISITCNKFKGIRCALSHNEYTARICREHNDANVLAFGARVIGQAVALEMVDAFFEGSFGGGRHGVRVDQLKALEDKNFK